VGAGFGGGFNVSGLAIVHQQDTAGRAGLATNLATNFATNLVTNIEQTALNPQNGNCFFYPAACSIAGTVS